MWVNESKQQELTLTRGSMKVDTSSSINGSSSKKTRKKTKINQWINESEQRTIINMWINEGKHKDFSINGLTK